MGAPGNFTLYNKAKLNALNLSLLNSAADSYKWTLHTSAYTPDVAAHEVYADLTNELATGNGYTSGGLALPNDALTLTGSTISFTGDPAIWTAAGGSIPAFRYAVLRAVGTFGGKVDPLIGYFVGDATPADVAATTAGNTIKITPNASGLIAG